MTARYWLEKLDEKVRGYMDRGLRPKKIFFFIQKEWPDLEVTSKAMIYRSITRIQRSSWNQDVKSEKLRKTHSVQKNS